MFRVLVNPTEMEFVIHFFYFSAQFLFIQTSLIVTVCSFSLFSVSFNKLNVKLMDCSITK